MLDDGGFQIKKIPLCDFTEKIFQKKNKQKIFFLYSRCFLRIEQQVANMGFGPPAFRRNNSLGISAAPPPRHETPGSPSLRSFFT
jgi:hypothetical protein